VATTWLDADRQKAIERLERRIRQVTPSKGMLLDTFFQHCEQYLLQEVRTKATSASRIFAKELALRQAAAEDKVYGGGKHDR
jgi:hypothetical protein